MANDSILLAIEFLIQALGKSKYAIDFLVRGSFVSLFLMGPYARKCNDLDLLYLQSYDCDVFYEMMNSLLQQAGNEKLRFDCESIVIDEIWLNSLSPGVRINESVVNKGLPQYPAFT